MRGEAGGGWGDAFPAARAEHNTTYVIDTDVVDSVSVGADRLDRRQI